MRTVVVVRIEVMEEEEEGAVSCGKLVERRDRALLAFSRFDPSSETAFAHDLSRGPPVEEADVALLLKSFPCLEHLEPGRYKVISRSGSYHGTTAGVLWLGGAPTGAGSPTGRTPQLRSLVPYTREGSIRTDLPS